MDGSLIRRLWNLMIDEQFNEEGTGEDVLANGKPGGHQTWHFLDSHELH
jgi:hypothetical protein